MVNWLELAGRYSLMPNCLGYCGGSNFAKVFSAYKKGKASAQQLKKEIRKFKGEYAYLKTIARANKIHDPFDSRVLEAFWHGNNLLKRVTREDVVRLIREDFIGKVGMDPKRAEKKIAELPLHPYIQHDFNSLFLNFVGNKVPRTIKNYDKCRIAQGEVLLVMENVARVLYRPLVKNKNGYKLGLPVAKYFKRSMHGICPEPGLKPGDKVTLHWGLIVKKVKK